MTYRAILDVKEAATPSSALFSFALDLSAGETISSASVAATVYSGTDVTPSAIISGAATISGGEVTQTLVNGTEGVVYLLTCTATTSASDTLTRTGYLVVAPATV